RPRPAREPRPDGRLPRPLLLAARAVVPDRRDGGHPGCEVVPALHPAEVLSARLWQSAAVPENRFGEHVAARYDDTSAAMLEPAVVDPAVELLAGLAGEGVALELGIGTGRIALPLARHGTPVHGIDLSEEMVARLRAKPGGEQLPVTIGDFAVT